MAAIKWTHAALSDLTAIAEYYDRSSPEYAKSVISQLYNSVSRLEQFPQSGRQVPELSLDHIRELIIEGYRIIYLVQEDEIDILAVAHSRQDLTKKLSRP